MILLDTNIIIDHLRVLSKKLSHLEIINQKEKNNLAISVVTIQELYEGKSTLYETQKKELLAIISQLKILSYTYEIAQYAGELARDLSRPIEFPDAAIASTAIINHCQLCTLNHKDFKNIKQLQLYSLNSTS